MRQAMLTVSGFLTAGLAVADPSAARAHVCQSAIASSLQSYGIAADRVISTTVYGRSMGGGGDDEGVGIGYRFWMRMKGCDKGYLIVDTDFVCNVEQTVTDGPCKIAGVPDC